MKTTPFDKSRPPELPGRSRMATRYPCERVGLDFVDSARYRFVSTVDLASTPKQLFEVLAEADSWSRWATAIADVTWTSPQPYGVGTTRTVTMRGGAVNDAEFVAWERFSHMRVSAEPVHDQRTRRVRRGLSRCRTPPAAAASRGPLRSHRAA